MTALDATLLATLPDWAFAFVLLMARAGSLCMLLPGVGEAEIPATIRLGFALALAAVLLPIIQPLVPAGSSDGWHAAAMLTGEIITGLWLGWITRLWLLALPIAGQIIASMTGLANILQPDPMLGAQSSVVSRALGLAAPVAVLASGLYALPLNALAGSYSLVPPGAVLPAADTAATVADGVTGAFALSLQLASPFVLGGIVWQFGAALLARLVPQLQIYFAAIPGQIIGGLALFGLLATTLMDVWLSRVAAIWSAFPG
jgi:flagellar biosynthetic protein FliR